MRERVDTSGVFAPYVVASALTVTEVAFARTVERLCGPLCDLELLALAVGAALVRLGQGRVDLAGVDDLFAQSATGPLVWPDPTTWVEVLATSSVVLADRGEAEASGPDQRYPLVLNGTTLALERYVAYERLVAGAIETRNGGAPGATVPSDIVDALFGDAPSTTLQRLAAERVFSKPVTIIAGGPGTGKTHTIARILLARAADAERRGVPGGDVLLVAPTGKAAARMTDAVRRAVGEAAGAVALSAHSMAALETLGATTIHRALGRRSGTSFAHDRHDPLQASLVICDETSMVSLPLMARLLDALDARTRIVFVGDPAQLASIDVGTVMSDLVGPASDQGDVGYKGALTGAVTVLRHTHRFADASPIAALARAIRGGDVDAVMSLLSEGSDELVWIEPTQRLEHDALMSLLAASTEEASEAAAKGDAALALDVAHRLKVLCAHREGSGGLAEWTARLAGVRRHTDAATWWRPRAGTPFMVTANDVGNRLANGDTGIFVEGSAGIVAALDDGGIIRLVAPSRLGRWEPWWAMTIHKSQGSEFDHVVVSLPSEPSRLVSRELLYTAVTRARERVTIVATDEVLRAAIVRRVERASGLEARLWHAPHLQRP